MKTRRDYLRLLIFLVTSCLADPALAGQAMQTINIATSAAGQSGYIAALIENKKLDVKYGIKINNMMMDFTEAANAVKLGRTTASSMQPSTAVNLVKSGTDIRLITPQIWSGNSWVVRKDAPYKSFGDLKGKKIGTPEYAMTAGVWIRGFFSDDYGVRAQDMKWFLGGQTDPGRKERVKLDLPPEISVQSIPDDKTLNGMLESGEIDALISARSPSGLGDGSGKVRRLFPNYKEVEIEYYKRTKIFPIMHILVVRKGVYERHPWVARSLFKAFCDAKNRAMETMHISNAHAYALPWLLSLVNQ